MTENARVKIPFIKIIEKNPLPVGEIKILKMKKTHWQWLFLCEYMEISLPCQHQIGGIQTVDHHTGKINKTNCR